MMAVGAQNAFCCDVKNSYGESLFCTITRQLQNNLEILQLQYKDNEHKEII